MLLSAVSFLVVAQSSSEIPEGLMNNPVFINEMFRYVKQKYSSPQHKLDISTKGYVAISGIITESDANRIRTPHLVICHNTMKKNFKML